MKLCSACLLGIKCRYNGEDKVNEKIIEISKHEKFIPVCPEQLGGLETPREESEIQMDGSIKTKSGKDITNELKKGAEEVLKIAKKLGITEAILKQKSPSCGCGKIYDGTFSGKIIEGDGTTAMLLKKNGIKIKTEEDL
jgi:uncharacterized protein YbbK (DUF523 family)